MEEMKSNDALRQKEARIAELQRENEALSQQVKRLIKAEGKLYAYQEELDAQLKEYKDLYQLNRKLNATLDLTKIRILATEFVIRNLDYERAVFLQLLEHTGKYHVCAVDGYYDPEEKDRVAQLAIEQEASFLAPLMAGREYLLCKADSKERELAEFRARLRMNEYFVYPLGTYMRPHALLAVGNTAENAEFYRKVSDSNGTLLSMGNFVGLISASIENYIFFHKMEEALELERLAEARYRSIFENAVEGIFQRTPEGRYIDANPALARMLGYASPRELMANVTDIGQQLYVQPERHAEFMRLLEEQGVVEGFETQLYRKDGSVIWMSISARAVRDSTGQVLYYEGIGENVTARKRGEEALRESEQKYRQLSEALEQRVREAVDELRQKDKILILQGRQAVMGEMISNIAHQWRQPLNILGLLAQDLQMAKELGDVSKELIDANAEKTMEVIQQMSRTIDDFRHFFKPDKEKVEFRVSEAIEKTLSMLEGSFRAGHVGIDIERTDDPIISGYPGEFTQVLLNILINARDAFRTRKIGSPKISIRLSTEGSKTVLTIADNAGGIPEAIIDKIFEPYFTTKGPDQGTGIGLFMCKTIIEKNMDGALTARNVGDGAEFRIEV